MPDVLGQPQTPIWSIVIHIPYCLLPPSMACVTLFSLQADWWSSWQEATVIFHQINLEAEEAGSLMQWPRWPRGGCGLSGLIGSRFFVVVGEGGVDFGWFHIILDQLSIPDTSH